MKTYRRSTADRILNAIANIPKRERLKLFRRCRLQPKFQVDHSHLEASVASDVPLRCLHRSVAEQKLNPFQSASPTMAQAGAGAAKIAGCQIVYAGLSGAPLHRVPGYVGFTPAGCSIPPFKTRLNTFRRSLPNAGAKYRQSPCTTMAWVPFVAVLPYRPN
jgi:hypothetical protein